MAALLLTAGAREKRFSLPCLRLRPRRGHRNGHRLGNFAPGTFFSKQYLTKICERWIRFAAAKPRCPIRSIHDLPRPSKALALRTRVPQPSLYPLNDQRWVKLGHCVQAMRPGGEDHLSGRRAGVHAFGEGDKLNAERLICLQRPKQVRRRPREPVELPNHDATTVVPGRPAVVIIVAPVH